MRIATASRRLATSAVAVLLVAACGSGDVAEQQATTDGVVQAVERAQRGALRGDADAVLDTLSDDCRSQIDESEVRFALLLAPGLLESFLDDIDVDDLDVEVDVVEFDGTTASVEVALVGPDGEAIEGFDVGSPTIDMLYEDGRWVTAECEFIDESEQEAERVEEALGALGFAGTRDDPLPLAVAAPIGDGYVMSVDSIDPDAEDALRAENEFLPEPEPGEQFVVVGVTVGYEGDDEPQPVTGFQATAVGPSSVGIDSHGCGVVAGQLGGSRDFFTGGVLQGELCFAVPSDQVDGLLISASAGFSLDREVFFDPTATVATPVPVLGATGPAPDGRLTDARAAPTALGETVDLGQGWSISVRGFEADATAGILAAGEFNDPPPDGAVYSLVDYELRFEGDEDAQSGFVVDVGLVGDSNVSADDFCSVSGVPDELDRFVDLFSGGAISGNQCFVVDRDDLDSLVMYASVGFDEDHAVLALR